MYLLILGSPDEEKKRLIRHARKKAAEDAWLRETELHRAGFKGSRSWNPEEKRELLEKGKVSNYHGMIVYDTDLYPMLADDPTAVAFHKITAGTTFTDV